MNEITKLYENAKIKKQYCGWLDMGDLDCQMQYVSCNSINEWKEAVFSSRFGESEEEPELKYPPFTAEKQLRIIELLVRKGMLLFTFSTKESYKVCGFCRGSNYCSNINEAFANYINTLWQDLSETEKEEIRNILNES